MLGRHYAAGARREIHGRKLKGEFTLPKKTDSSSGPEMKLARYLASAFVAYSHGIGMDYACKKYAHMPVAAFWIQVALW